MQNTNGDIVQIHIGLPCDGIGHQWPSNLGSNGVSYFDRLWRTGAGSRAEVNDRFIVAMVTTNRSSKATTENNTTSLEVSNESKEGKVKNVGKKIDKSARKNNCGEVTKNRKRK